MLHNVFATLFIRYVVTIQLYNLFQRNSSFDQSRERCLSDIRKYERAYT